MGARRAARVIVLILLNLAAHFLPFERRGFEADDYNNYCRTLTLQRAALTSQALTQPDRPLFWWLNFEVARLVGLDAGAQLVAVVLTSTLLALSGFALFVEITGCERSSFWLTALFILWPAHHALHGTVLLTTSTGVDCLYMAAATLFLRFTRTGGPAVLAASLSLYALSLFSYELGFLAPVVAWGVARAQGRPRCAWAFTFAVVALLNLGWRSALASATPLGPVRVPSLSALALNTAWVLPAHFVGHIALRNVLYGLWGFLHLPVGLLAFGLVCATLAWVGAPQMLEDLPNVDSRRMMALLLGLYLLAAPAALLLVESRHTVLSSLAFAPLLGQALRALSRVHHRLVSLLVAILVLANQGLALRQAEAGRLSEATFSAVRDRHALLKSSAQVVFDLAGLGREIPHTWRPKPDVLRTYWGLYMFAPWGLEGMLCDSGIPEKRALGCVEPLRFTATQVECPRVFFSAEPGRSWSAARSETAVLGYEEICGKKGSRCPPLAGR